MSVRVAVAQTAPRIGDVDHNLGEVEELAAGLAGRMDLLVLPELFTTGYRRLGMDHAALAEPIPEGPSLARLSRLAASTDLTLIGTLLEAADGRVYDTAVVIGPDGKVTATYRKTHLYPAERAHFAPGDRLVTATAAGLRIGLAICFEHAFPEIFTELALAGAQLVAIPSAVPVGFEYLLDLRTRARAQDNQLYVAAANLVGFDGESRWCGASMIVGPRGEVLARAGGEQPELIESAIDPAAIEGERAQEPALINRRPDLYSRLRST
ncbi:MAG TPA: carbon-nitrogen hydrolase family protein [candidate division Zixibacteria bacterium]|nr:carbon-nitrogen hydrolase family protein [candidate division Zixibacteria bacterium]